MAIEIPSYSARVTHPASEEEVSGFIFSATAVVDGVEFTATHNANNIRVLANNLIAVILEGSPEDYTFEVNMLTSKGRMSVRHNRPRLG